MTYELFCFFHMSLFTHIFISTISMIWGSFNGNKEVMRGVIGFTKNTFAPVRMATGFISPMIK